MDELLAGREPLESVPAEGERLAGTEEVVDVDGQPQRALRERAVEVELGAARGLQQGLLAESVVEVGSQLGLDPREAQGRFQHPHRLREQRPGDEQVQVAEHPPGGVGIGEVGQGHTLQDAVLQAGGVEGDGGLEEESLDSKGVGQPGLELLLDPVVLAGGDRHSAVPHRDPEQAEETVVLALSQQVLELLVTDRTESRGRWRPRQPVRGDTGQRPPTGVVAPRPP